MSEKFQINFDGRTFYPESDDLFCVLHRDEGHQDLDYFAFADHERGHMINVIDSPEAARWVAGIAFEGLKLVVPKIKGLTFQERYGWVPHAVVIRERAEPEIQDQWVRFEVEKDVHDDQLTLPEDI